MSPNDPHRHAFLKAHAAVGDLAGPVTGEMMAGWRRQRRLWNNAIAMLGPVL